MKKPACRPHSASLGSQGPGRGHSATCSRRSVLLSQPLGGGGGGGGGEHRAPFHQKDKLSRDIKMLKKNQIEILELNNRTGGKSSLRGLQDISHSAGGEAVSSERGEVTQRGDRGEAHTLSIHRGPRDGRPQGSGGRGAGAVGPQPRETAEGVRHHRQGPNSHSNVRPKFKARTAKRRDGWLSSCTSSCPADAAQRRFSQHSFQLGPSIRGSSITWELVRTQNLGPAPHLQNLKLWGWGR